MALLAILAGACSVVFGLGGSLRWDTPAGPSVVVAAAALFALSLLAGALRGAPRHGP
jgi:zinc transport system permease protein